MRKHISLFLLIILLCSTLKGAAYGLNLKESIDTAVKNNPAVLSADKKVVAADAKLYQAIGAFVPSAKLEGNYGRNYTQPSEVQIMGQKYIFGTDEIAKNKSWTGTVSQPIFVAALFPGFQIAKKNADISRENLKQAILETAFNAIQSYFGVLRAEKNLELSEQSKEMAASHLKNARALTTAGVATRADLYLAEVQMAKSEVDLTRNRNLLEFAKNSLNNALGRDIIDQITVEQQNITETAVTLPNYKDLLDIAFKNRPDWKSFILSKEISEQNIHLAQTEYLPNVFLSGQTGNRVTTYPSYGTDVKSWTIAGIGSWTLFDGLARENKVREASANLDAQKATEDQVRHNIELDVRQAYLELKNAVETIGSAKAAVKSAEENYKVSNLRYNTGSGMNLEVVNAEVQLTQSQVNYYETLFNLEVAKAKVNKTIAKELFKQ